MIKVFLVEDEYVIREGIKKNIDWQAHGYEFCGEAGDGELAFPMIQEIRPDIVITDIRMPFMDGLALSRLIKKEFPETEIIILSGYEEFEYAKEGIKIGVAQYLLKPINGDALIKEIDLVAASIEERKQKERIRERFPFIQGNSGGWGLSTDLASLAALCCSFPTLIDVLHPSSAGV